MEKRRSKRKPVDLLKVDVISEDAKFSGVIENINEYGMHLIAASRKCEKSLIPESILELKFESPLKNRATLSCEIRWVHINKTPIHGLTYRMGMEILEYPTDYNDLLNSLE